MGHFSKEFEFGLVDMLILYKDNNVKSILREEVQKNRISENDFIFEYASLLCGAKRELDAIKWLERCSTGSDIWPSIFYQKALLERKYISLNDAFTTTNESLLRMKEDSSYDYLRNDTIALQAVILYERKNTKEAKELLNNLPKDMMFVGNYGRPKRLKDIIGE